jgi:hypothetical protein
MVAILANFSAKSRYAPAASRHLRDFWTPAGYPARIVAAIRSRYEGCRSVIDI